MTNLFKKHNIDINKYKNQTNDEKHGGIPSIGSQIWEEYNKPRFELGTIGDVLTGLETGHGEDVHGLMQLLTPGQESEASRETTREREEKYQRAVENSPYATRAGYIGGKVGLPLLATAAAGPLGLVMSQTLPASLAARAAPYAAKYAQLGQGNKYLKYLKAMLENAGKGAGWGATSYVNPNETRAEHAGYGAVGGAAAKPIFDTLKAVGYTAPNAIIKKGLEYLLPEKGLARDIFGKLTPEELEKMAHNKKVAKKMGIQLTPGEASGSQIVKDIEAGFGKTEKGNEKLFRHGEARKKAEEEAIGTFMEKVSPHEKSAAKEVRQAAEEAIKGSKKALQEKAAPFYKEAEKDLIPPNKFNSLMRDSILEDAYTNVSKNKNYASKLKNVPRNSIEYLHQMKEYLGDEISAAIKSGRDREAGLIKDAQNKLVKQMDAVSPNYKKARGIYAEEMPGIKELTEGNVGRLAKLKGSQLKNASKIIFDPHETDIEQLIKYRNTVGKQNPDAWRNIVRNEMERQISKKETGSKGRDFYSAILKDDTKFKQFYEALGNFYGKGKTPEQKMLENLRDTFIHLEQYKTKAFQVEKEIPKGAMKWVDQKVHALLGGKYDKKAIEMITDPNWEKYVKHAFPKEDPSKVMKDPSKVVQLLEGFNKKHFETALVKGYSSKNRGEE